MDNAEKVLLGGAGLHLAFVAGEMLPWDCPFILQKVKAERGVEFPDDDQAKLVATIVHNAGIYNVILASGLLWSAFPKAVGPSLEPASVKAIRCFFLSGAVVAGVFGLTLSRKTLAQALVGLAGLYFVCRD